MSFYTGQEPRDLPFYRLGAWYELPHNEVAFRLFEPPQRVYGTELHTGPAQLADGRVVVLVWPPWTKLRPGPVARFLRRVGRALRLVPPRPLPPAELRRSSSPATSTSSKSAIAESVGAKNVGVSYEPTIIDAHETTEVPHG